MSVAAKTWIARSLTLTGVTVILAMMLAPPAFAQNITSVTPGEGTVGTKVVIEGAGFGVRKPRVFLTQEGSKKKFELTILEFRDDQIVGSIKQAKAGTFDLNVQPKPKGTDPIVSPDAFTVRLPSDLSFDRRTVGPGEAVTVTGTFLGAKKGQVLFGGTRAKVVEWNAVDETLASFSFRVPKRVADGLYDMELKTLVGRVVERDALVVGNAPDPNNAPPEVVSAGATDNTHVLVQYSEPMLGGPGSAENPTHYRITASLLSAQSAVQETGGKLLDTGPLANDPELSAQLVAAPPSLVILDAELLADNPTVVRLTTLSQAGLEYTVKVTNVRDLAGNPIAPPNPLGGDPSSTMFIGIPPDVTTTTDSDGDGLSDSAEQAGWVVTVIKTNGEVSATEVTSNPGDPRLPVNDPVNVTARDTDGDGVSDLNENIFGTDPRSPDTDGDELTDDQELNQVFSEPAEQDTDRDGFPDGLEFNFFRTSPLLADTDGDQFTDSEEVLQANRDPRRADLPRHSIGIGEVAVELNVEYAFETTRDLSSFENQTASVTVEQSTATEISTTDTTTTEWFAKAGVESSAGAGFPKAFAASIEFTAEAGVGASGTFVENETSKQASQQVFDNSLESGAVLEAGETETRAVTGAKLVIPLNIENAGDIAFTMSDVEITALIPNPANPTRFIPIGTLLATAGTSTTYNFGTIDTKLGPFRFVTNEDTVNPDLIESLMSNPQSIIFEVSNFDLVDEFGNNFAFQQQDVTERTAPVVIDFGDGEVERYWAAIGTGRVIDTNGNGSIDAGDERVIFDAEGKPVGITLLQALEEIVGLARIDLDTMPDVTDPGDRSKSFATKTVNGVLTVVRIREVESDDLEFSNATKAWVLLTGQGYDPDLPIEEVLLFSGQGVTFAFIQDADNDRVARRIELIYGSSDQDSDTDDDGRQDGEEIYESCTVAVVGALPIAVFSNPVFADFDGDGVNDFFECRDGTDPNNPDTDGDGACDGPGVPGCPFDQFPLDPGSSGRPALLGEYLFSGNPNDNSGNGPDGQIAEREQCVALTQDRFDDPDSAYRFNNDNDPGCGDPTDGPGEIQIPHLDFSRSFSIAAWVNVRSRNDQWIVGQAAGAGDVWARLQIGKLAIDDLGASQRVSLIIPRSGTAAGDLVLTDTAPVPTDQWVLYSAVVSVSSDGIGTTARLYRNTLLVAELAVDGVYENPSDSDRFFVGGVEQADAYDGGLIDDVRIYGGPLSAVNVQELFEEGGFMP